MKTQRDLGDEVRRLMKQARMTQGTMACRLRLSRLSVNAVIMGRRTITANMALRLGKIFKGYPPLYWLNLQRDIDLATAEKEYASELSQIH